MSIASNLLNKFNESDDSMKMASERNASRIGKTCIGPDGKEIPGTVVLSKFSWAKKENGNILVYETNPYDWKSVRVSLNQESVRILSKLM